jgi:dTDP-4-dehydrorhamnose 3,5-epimerase
VNVHRDLPDVVGAEQLQAKHSAVDVAGNLQELRVAGVEFRPTRPVPHEDGHVTEVARAS